MKNEPKIRIKGFEGEWTKCTLSDIATFSKGHGYSKNDLTNKKDATPIILYGKMYTKYEPIIIKVDTFAYLLPNSILSEGTEVIVPASGETAEDISVASAICTKGIIIGGDLNILKPKEGIFAPFLALNITYSHAHYELSKKAQGKTIVHLHNVDFKDVHVCYPTFPEQRAIATYFRNLDSLIETADKKLASLKQVKEASLQSMFPKEGQKVPEVRFKGFEGEWKTVQLCDCLEVSKERNLDNKYGIEDVLSVSDDSGVTNQIELLGRSFAGKSVSNYGILHEGEIVYTKSPLKSKPFGIIKRNNYKTGIVSVLYAIYKPHIDISSAYIHYYFSPSWRLNNYIHPLVNKGAKNTMNISDETALMGYIPLPPTLSEQRKIASFFVHLDKQIAIAQQRLDLLRRIKSACLNEMFV